MAEHLFIGDDFREPRPFTSPQSARTPKAPIRRHSRKQHAAMLQRQLNEAWQASAGAAPDQSVVAVERELGIYLSFAVRRSHSDCIKGLMDERSGIRIRTVSEGTGDLAEAVIVTVWVPKDKHRFFIKKLQTFGASESISIAIVPEHGETIKAIAKSKGYKRARVMPLKSGVTKFYAELPSADIESFIRELGDHVLPETLERHPAQEGLITSIDAILGTMLDYFCPFGLPEGEGAMWLEVWLATENDREAMEGLYDADRSDDLEADVNMAVESRFHALADTKGLRVANERLTFPDRVVLLAEMTRDQANTLLLSSDDIAEFRPAESCTGYLYREGKTDQDDVMEDALKRIRLPASTDTAVCILDTGVNRAHPLLGPILAESDCHAVEPEWLTSDHEGHGTEMAGLAAYGGTLDDHLIGHDEIRLTHVLESVKLLPPRGRTEPHLWGDFTDQAVGRASSAEGERQRCFSMAITSDHHSDRNHVGRPSSWSGGIDQIAYGHRDDDRRLFIISAGNTSGEDYPDRNLASSIESPGQSWNALTVGAFTAKTQLCPDRFPNHVPLASEGNLSPWSTTAVEWEKKWPNKPDVVFEGGNLAVDKHTGQPVDPEDLCLLTTSREFITRKPFTVTNGTSAACAQASHMAAALMADYPHAWPETIRGLIVHSAEWTPAMRAQFLSEGVRNGTRNGRREYANLLRIVGNGVPDYRRARECGDNSLTLISQQLIQPYKKDGSRGRSNQMHLHRLPWPKDTLEDLGEQPVSISVTLSYFIDPSPEGRAWAQRYRYQSHAFRFAMKKPGQREEDFIAHINAEIMADEDEADRNTGTTGELDKWLIGTQARHRGSIHSDRIPKERLTAAELADCNVIGVFPVVGWFRERLKAKRHDEHVRYSLIVSIETKATDIYTPVRTIIENTVPTIIA